MPQFGRRTFVPVARLLVLLVVSLLLAPLLPAQQTPSRPELTVEKIMRDPKWIGTAPRNPYWSEDGKQIYFLWNPEEAESDSLYVVSRSGGTPRKLSPLARRKVPSPRGDYTRDHRKKTYEKYGDIYLLDVSKMQIRQLTQTVDKESNPRFTQDERGITFVRNNNLFLFDLTNETVVQLTDLRKGQKPKQGSEAKTEAQKWLRKQQLELFDVLRKRKRLKELRQKLQEAESPPRPKKIYIGKQRVLNLQLSPDRRYVTFLLRKESVKARRTMVPRFVTESGYTEETRSRTKVGDEQPTYRFQIYNIAADTVYGVQIDSIPGIFPEKAPKESTQERKGKSKPREVLISGPVWSEDGSRCFVDIRSSDNKDRWLMLLEPETGRLTLLDRQHDDAWIGGPGIGWRGFGASVGWMPDNRRIWFVSEADGYAHMYTVDVTTMKKQQLTRGRFEIYRPRISRDKKRWYFSSNEVHPGERHFYTMPLNGGKRTQLTSMSGRNDVVLSPDEKWLLIRYSFSNRPPELYVMANRPGAPARQLTSSLTAEFKAYPWRAPQIVTFRASDSAVVYARLYRPERPQPGGKAVIFVHGAGYLQNAHKWWSSYFREYMFHNLLADRGYTVLDIDYRGSAGYGRDWRTAIYRHMGGKDLSDQVDGARFLVQKYGIDPKRIGIYGGSYGGFLTLMAMFTKADVFAAGAALRPVTDWAHYNHPYTSNILNTPVGDSTAYKQSSPIYFAEGLKGPLLICHGMADTNVHFQDVVRLAQRLIELRKESWQVAIYPVEGHGFREPTSWMDEYKRILKLFEENL